MIPSSLLLPYRDVNVPAPPQFTPAENVEWAKWESNVISMQPDGRTFSQKLGVRYERQVQSYLAARFAGDYYNNPWFTFRDQTGIRRCRPDGLLLSGGRVVLFEIKIRHVPDAWWQLRKLYSPVLKVAMPDREVRVLEVVKEFDPATPFPERPRVLEKLDDIWTAKEFPDFGVYQWKR